MDNIDNTHLQPILTALHHLQVAYMANPHDFATIAHTFATIGHIPHSLATFHQKWLKIHLRTGAERRFCAINARIV
jgi:hypothetical protein